MDSSKILADLQRHKSMFDLNHDGLGDALLQVAAEGVAQSFEAKTDADGNHWPELSSKYAEWKAKHYPGRPMGVKEGLMREGMEGERSISADAATYTFGQTEEQRDEAEWFQEGSTEDNRPARPFVGLTQDATVKSKEILIDHMEQHV